MWTHPPPPWDQLWMDLVERARRNHSRKYSFIPEFEKIVAGCPQKKPESLFTGNETDEISDVWILLANFVCGLYAEELMGTIKKAYDDDLIASGTIRYEDFN